MTLIIGLIGIALAGGALAMALCAAAKAGDDATKESLLHAKDNNEKHT